jgi:2-keto-4-pentenoate hydratase/2-oxohepta-3-ene-1,7-dioic acid hydratase in catechol pathway
VSSLAIRNVYCIGRNYADHALELGNDPKAKPLIFMKPATARVRSGGVVPLPVLGGACHHEVELALQINKEARFIKEEQALDCISGYAIALDMTLRDLQSELKKAGRSWEMAKAFEGSMPLSEFVPAVQITDPGSLTISLWINDKLVQRGNTNQMILRPHQCVAYVSKYFHLRPGDVILTGTPAGVGAVNRGDKLRAEISGLGALTVEITEEILPPG